MVWPKEKYKRQGRPPIEPFEGRRTKLPGFDREVIHPYKYMRIYLWSALRTMVLKMGVLRKRDLIADLHCLLTRQEDGG